MFNYAKEKLKIYQSERIGQEKYNKQGYLIKVVGYNNAHDVIVEFNDDYKTQISCEWSQFEKGTIVNPITYGQRLGQTRYNKQGYLMKVVEYRSNKDIVVEFDDYHKTRINCRWSQFDNGSLINTTVYNQRLGKERLNNQGCLMKLVQYNNSSDIVVEFQDEYKAKVHAAYREFKEGSIKNPYHRSVYGVGITGNKYPTRDKNGIQPKEYNVWKMMLIRCFDETYKNKHPTYKNAICCEEWLLYENFYEWLHGQPNFDKWLNNSGWNIDKDIIIKRNKVYSPETCCLVPNNVNKLFVKNDTNRGHYLIGVSKTKNGYGAYCHNPLTNKQEFLGYHSTNEKAFSAYKVRKEDIIKQVAKIEYDKGNITGQCYEAMINYIVEIDD